jgi:hypothetical protein
MKDERVFKKAVTFVVEYNVKYFDVKLVAAAYPKELSISGFPMQIRDIETNEVNDAIYSLYV